MSNYKDIEKFWREMEEAKARRIDELGIALFSEGTSPREEKH